MEDSEFEKLVAAGIDALPEEIGENMDNVAVVIADEPTPMQRYKLMLRPHTLLFGLYEGVPKTKRGYYTMVPPDKITIFKNQILRVTGPDSERIAQFVKDTVWHEVAHHYGLNEQEVRALEHKRREQHSNT